MSLVSSSLVNPSLGGQPAPGASVVPEYLDVVQELVERAGLRVLSFEQDCDHGAVVVGFQSHSETVTFKTERCRYRGRATLRGRLVAIAQRLQAEGGVA